MAKNVKKKKKEVEHVKDVAPINMPNHERFLMFPLFLLANSKYNSLSNEAKLLYMLMKERLSLSIKNNWVDGDGNPYIILTIERMKEILHKSKTPVINAKDELINANLIHQSKDGLDPKQKKNLPNRYYILNVDYTFGDLTGIKNNVKAQNTDLDDKNSKNVDKSMSTSNSSNNQNQEIPTDQHSVKVQNMDLNDANAQSLYATAPMANGKNQSNQGIPDKSTFSRSPKNRTQLNKHNSSCQYNNRTHNKSTYTTTSITTNKDIKEIEDSTTTLKAELNKDIPNVILNSNDYNVLREDTLIVLAKWLQDLNQVQDYAERISWAVTQEVNKSGSANQTFYQDNKNRILYQISGVVKSRVNDITQHRFDIRNPSGYIFSGVRDKTNKILNDHNLLDNPFRYMNKHTEKGTDWSKKKAPDNSGISTGKLRELFKDLDNK